MEENRIKVAFALSSQFVRDAQYFHGPVEDEDNSLHSEDWGDAEGDLVVWVGSCGNEREVQEALESRAQYYGIPKERFTLYRLAANPEGGS